MQKEPHAKEEMIEGVREIIDQNLNKVETEIDSTVESAKGSVHAIRTEAEMAAERALNRLRGSWDRTQQKLEAQMAQHPWMVLGGVLLVGFLLSRSQQPRAQIQAPEPRPRY
jgi:hypothetical protein